MRKNNKGITLIALVVTIIVLLILAGVAIVTLTGDNGIINKTATAKQMSEEKAASWLCSKSQWTDYVDDTKAELMVINLQFLKIIIGLEI